MLTNLHDQLNVTAEGNHSDHHVVWHHSQTDTNGSSNCNTSLGTWNEGMRPSHSCVTGSQRIVEETIEEVKAVSAWPVQSAYSTACSSKPKTESILDPGEKVKKAETAARCRLFGIDLIGHSVSPQPLEQVSGGPPNMSAISSVGSVPDSHLKTELSKSCKENNQEQSQLWRKEKQSKRNLTSSRSRTKVHRKG